MPGPPPNPNARRTNARPDWVKLPSEGRQGAPPKWPLLVPEGKELADYVSGIWRDVWATPQAAMWERLRWTRTVARYVLVLAMAETTAKRDPLSEARQLEDHLGLTPMSLKRLQWVITEDEVAAQRSTGTGKKTKAEILRAV